MIPEGSALAAGARSLLDVWGEAELSALVERSAVELAGAADRWSMGSREVCAYRVVLTVSATDHVLLTAQPNLLSTVRDAFAAAARTPETELESLSLVLALPPTGVGFHRHAYRDAPMARAEPPPPPAAVLSGAAELCKARKNRDAEGILRRASMEQSYVQAAARSMRRFLLRLDPADFARIERDPPLAESLLSAVRDAAATADDPASAIHFGLRLDGPLPELLDPEARLALSLAEKGVACVPVARLEGKSVLAAMGSSGVVLVEVASGGQGTATRGGEVKVSRLRVPEGALATAEGADNVSVQIVAALGAAKIR
ncbi:hypothetical protein [Polyangium jinanense]|uniref:Uncharacterized protein n=1 Tax=Polyangium jinanense TaxID=2829994 RepID=A0A9X3WZ36_9BACT|nr:hypothetical protein [Polyangium jinanense]MDC3953631.1 hypothetical protein [Polyangium jinanense]MDC3979248.1 hypothetical protein [Polyangium jinanense]